MTLNSKLLCVYYSVWQSHTGDQVVKVTVVCTIVQHSIPSFRGGIALKEGVKYMCKVKISCVDQFEASTSTPPPPPRHFNLWRLFCSNSQLDNSIPLSHLCCAGTTVKCQGVAQWRWGCWSSKLIGAQVLEHSFYISHVCRWWIHIT